MCNACAKSPVEWGLDEAWSLWAGNREPEPWQGQGEPTEPDIKEMG